MISLQAPGSPVRATIKIGGSKSISNRWLILRHIAGSATEMVNSSDSEDTVVLEKALAAILRNERVIDVGHAGTDMRFLTALLASTPGSWTLTGSARMKRRPVGALVESLCGLGAEIGYLEKKGFPPLKITGSVINGGIVKMAGNVSSQFISALLLASPLYSNGLTIITGEHQVSRPYIDMTIALLQQCGIEISVNGNTFTVKTSTLKIPGHIKVESDWSSASYWFSICALCPGSEIRLNIFNETSSQADAVLPSIYSKLGVQSAFSGSELVLTNTPCALTGFSYDFSQCPDISQTVAATCFGLGIPATLTGLHTLRIKETDRIAALHHELGKLGAEVISTNESITISGSPGKNIHTISTYGDHRMAMSFAPLALVMPGIRIQDPSVVAKSYPDFWNDLLSVGFSVNLQPS